MKASLQTMGALRSEQAARPDPVALEIPVVVTGARPGDTAAKRALFAEETQTVLVFENGAVIRLSAAVTDGQLLFLANKATGKEVVTQVLRKRAFRPTNCYVDIEFTEANPGFWGIDFPKSVGPSGGAAAQIGDQADDDGPKHTKPPDLEDVERLKQEVAALQDQLKSLKEVDPKGEEGKKAKVAAEIVAEVKKKEEEKKLQELLALEDTLEAAHAPKIRVITPRTPEQTKKRVVRTSLVAAAAAILLGLGGAYQFGLLAVYGLRPATKSAAAAATPVRPAATANTMPKQVPATAAMAAGSSSNLPVNAVVPNSPVANAIATKADPGTKPADTNLSVPSTVPSEIIVTEPKAKARKESKSAMRSSEKSVAESSSGSLSAASPPSSKANSLAPASTMTAAVISPTPGANAEEPVASSGSPPEDFVAPKLLKSVRPVAPPEVMKNYVTGNVNLDAIVDTTGHIRSVSVLSGPMKLRAHAIEEMKQYLYEPARKSGRPVLAHVKVSLQYWYEP